MGLDCPEQQDQQERNEGEQTDPDSDHEQALHFAANVSMLALREQGPMSSTIVLSDVREPIHCSIGSLLAFNSALTENIHVSEFKDCFVIANDISKALMVYGASLAAQYTAGASYVLRTSRR